MEQQELTTNQRWLIVAILFGACAFAWFISPYFADMAGFMH